MTIFYLPKFKSGLEKCPEAIKEKFYKQAEYLRKSIRHPSLHSKKYDESRGVWQARVDRSYRFYFFIKKDVILDLLHNNFRDEISKF